METLLPMHPALRRATVERWGVAAKEIGLGRVWAAELRSADPFVVTALLQAVAPGLPTGTGIASLYGRSVRSIAAAAIALSDGHDFILGIGVSNRAIAAWHDRRWLSPDEALPSAVGRIRGLLAGNRDEHGPSIHWRTASTGRAAPIHLAGVSERGVALASSCADGLVLNLVPPGSRLTRAVDAFRDDGGDRPVRCVVRVTPHLDPPNGQWQDWVEKEIETYAKAPGYREVLAERGSTVPDTLVVRGAERWTLVQAAYREAGVEPVVLPLVAPFEDPEEVVLNTWSSLATAAGR